jgi:hypothetical protein
MRLKYPGNVYKLLLALARPVGRCVVQQGVAKF